jgi:hypothetical protein
VKSYTLFQHLGERGVEKLVFNIPLQRPGYDKLPNKLGNFTAADLCVLATKLARDAQYICSHAEVWDMSPEDLRADVAALEADAKQLRALAEAMDSGAGGEVRQ